VQQKPTAPNVVALNNDINIFTSNFIVRHSLCRCTYSDAWG